MDRSFPAEFALGLAGVTDQRVNLGGPKVSFVESNVIFPI